MKKLVLFLNLVLGLVGTAFSDSLPITQFGGVDTDNNAIVMPAGRSPDSRNVITDETQGVGPRSGFTRFSTETTRNTWAYSPSNGTKYIIVQSSNVIKANSGSGSFIVVIGTVDVNVVTVAAQLGDSFFFTNVTDGLKAWDSNTTTVASTTMNFSQLVVYKGRLWGAGKPGKERIVWGSRFNDGTFWNLVTNPADDDPVQIQVSGGLDEVVTTLYATYKDMLIWAKANSFGAITGSRRSNFGQRAFSNEIGTAYPDTMRDCGGFLRFLGSRRIIWEFDGENLVDISRYKEGGGIRTFLGTIVQGDANAKVWSQSSQSDWTAGLKGVRVQTDISPGDVVFVSTSFTQNFDGSCSTNGPSVYIPCAPRWTVVSAALVTVSSGVYGNSDIYTPSTIAVGTWTYSVRYGLGAEAGALYFIAPTLATGYALRGTNQGLANGAWTVENLGVGIIISSTTGPMVVANAKVTRNEGGLIQLFLNEVFAGSVTDTNFTSSNFMVAALPGAVVLKITATESVLHSSFTSQSFNIGTKITSWGAFSANDNNDGGAIKYVLYTSTQANIDVNKVNTYQASQTVNANTIPTIATAPYVLIFSSFDRTDGNQQPTIHDFAVAWNEGTNLRAASLYTNQRWWLSVAVSSAANNTVIVFDRRREWQIYSGINADVMVMYQSNPYFGNVSGIFQAETGSMDNNAVISSYFRTRDYVLAQPETVSYLNDLYVYASNNTATLQTQYYVDGVNTAYSLPSVTMDDELGYRIARLPFSSSALNQAKTFSVKWSVSASVSWFLAGANLYHTPEKQPKGD